MPIAAKTIRYSTAINLEVCKTPKDLICIIGKMPPIEDLRFARYWQ
jgi:hypothetical protein